MTALKLKNVNARLPFSTELTYYLDRLCSKKVTDFLKNIFNHINILLLMSFG